MNSIQLSFSPPWACSHWYCAHNRGGLFLSLLIYLFHHLGTRLTKIGCTIYPDRREAQLQSQYLGGEFLWVGEGYKTEEETLHLLFAEKRIKGEWFDLDAVDIDMVRTASFSLQ